MNYKSIIFMLLGVGLMPTPLFTADQQDDAKECGFPFQPMDDLYACVQGPEFRLQQTFARGLCCVSMQPLSFNRRTVRFLRRMSNATIHCVGGAVNRVGAAACTAGSAVVAVAGGLLAKVNTDTDTIQGKILDEVDTAALKTTRIIKGLKKPVANYVQTAATYAQANAEFVKRQREALLATKTDKNYFLARALSEGDIDGAIHWLELGADPLQVNEITVFGDVEEPEGSILLEEHPRAALAQRRKTYKVGLKEFLPEHNYEALLTLLGEHRALTWQCPLCKKCLPNFSCFAEHKSEHLDAIKDPVTGVEDQVLKQEMLIALDPYGDIRSDKDLDALTKIVTCDVDSAAVGNDEPAMASITKNMSKRVPLSAEEIAHNRRIEQADWLSLSAHGTSLEAVDPALQPSFETQQS